MRHFYTRKKQKTVLFDVLCIRLNLLIHTNFDPTPPRIQFRQYGAGHYKPYLDRPTLGSGDLKNKSFQRVIRFLHEINPKGMCSQETLMAER